MISLDTPTLTQLISNCFKLSMDGALTDEQRNEFSPWWEKGSGALCSI